MNLAIIAITANGARLGTRLREGLGAADLFVTEKLAAEAGKGAIAFGVELRDLVRQLWREVDGFVFLMATGIVVRLIAPHLEGKERDPAVVVMDEKGGHAVSLLSGHLGGANELAREAARITGGRAVITTATDVNGLPAWDEVARRQGLVVEPLAAVRRLNALLLQGERIALVDRRGRVTPFFADVPGVAGYGTFAEALESGAAGTVFVTHRLVPGVGENPTLLLLRPKDLVVGIGCNRGTSAKEIEGAVKGELRRAFLSPAAIGRIATVEEKGDEAGLLAYARKHDLPLELHSAAALNAVAAPSAPSAHALAAVGAKGVCEPAAILSSGGGKLLVRKRKVGNVTVAVAETG